MQDLLNVTRDLDQDIFRNIVSLRETQNLFDDLDADEISTEVAIQAEMRVKQTIPSGFLARGFHYSTSIGYPFQTEPFMASRFGDGTYGVWYGGLELETTVFETVYHMVRNELAIEGMTEVVVRDRAVYRVHCRAVLMDLVGKEEAFPLLIADDYAFPQEIGRRLHHEGHPGLLAPSARRKGGINSVIFNPEVLHNPQNHCFLTYRLDPHRAQVTIERQPGQEWFSIPFGP
jgi:hypothetical protein